MFSGILGIAGAGAGGPARQIDTTPKITINSSKRQQKHEVSAAGGVSTLGSLCIICLYYMSFGCAFHIRLADHLSDFRDDDFAAQPWVSFRKIRRVV